MRSLILFIILIAACAPKGVPVSDFFFKQWGEWAPVDWCHHGSPARGNLVIHPTGQILGVHPCKTDLPRDRYSLWMEMARVGKRAAGRLLDGVEHSEIPLVGVSRG